MPLPRVSPVHQLGLARRLVKGTLAGKMLAALARLRRKPARVAAALRAQRADRRGAPIAVGRGRRLSGIAVGQGRRRSPIAVGQARRPSSIAAGRGRRRSPIAPLARRRFTIVYVLPAGPGSWPALRDTVESILHYDGGDAKVVVADDDSVDCREAVVRARFAAADVLRARWPTGGPPRQSPFQARVYAELMRRYDFDVLCKIDTDALVTGAGLGARAAAEFAARPGVGALGSLGVRADGVPEDYTYDDWVLAHSRRWSRAVATLQDAARSNGYGGPRVHGGVYLLSRAALEAAAAKGLLRASPPWWTSIGEDLWFSLVVAAAGFGLASWGAPGEPLVSASHHLPLHKEDVLREGKLAVHSVRRGEDGEDEAALRRFFREARAR